MGLTQLLSKQAVKLGIKNEVPASLDKSLPLGGRIGGLITLPSYPFVVAGADGALITLEAESARIHYISSFTIGSNKTYRYYLEGVRAFLQVTMEDGKLQDVTYFAEAHRLYPQDAEEFDNIVDGMGYQEFYCPVTEPPTTFTRCMGLAEEERVDPFTANMRSIYDPMGQTGREDKITLMYYSRVLDLCKPEVTTEYFLIEMVEPLTDSTEGVMFVYSFGLSLNPMSVQII